MLDKFKRVWYNKCIIKKEVKNMWYDFKNYIGNKLVKFIARHCCLWMDTFYEICGNYELEIMKAYIEYKEALMKEG